MKPFSVGLLAMLALTACQEHMDVPTGRANITFLKAPSLPEASVQKSASPPPAPQSPSAPSSAMAQNAPELSVKAEEATGHTVQKPVITPAPQPVATSSQNAPKLEADPQPVTQTNKPKSTATTSQNAPQLQAKTQQQAVPEAFRSRYSTVNTSQTTVTPAQRDRIRRPLMPGQNRGLIAR